MGKKQWKDWNTFTHSISSFEHNPYTYYFSKFESTFGVNGMCTWKQGRINAHLTGGVQISLGGCIGALPKGLTGLLYIF